MASPTPVRANPISPHAAEYGFDIGDRVLCGNGKAGIARYLDTTEFAAGIWAGIELTQGLGKNDGSVQGKRYFECDHPKGLFILANKVTKAPTAAPSRYAVRHTKTSALRQAGGLQRMGSQESLNSIGASSIASSRMFTPKIVRKPNINLNLGNSYDQTIKTLQESLREKENHLAKVIQERESDQMEIARLTGLKCLSPTRSTAPNKTEWPSEDQVKEFEAEISRLTNLVEQKTKELEDLAFTLEEERANAQCLEERVKELEAQCTEQQKSINDDIPEGNEEELNQLRDEIDRHKQEQERLNAVLEERSKEQSTLQKEKEDILKQCQANEHALAELQAKLNEQEAVQTQLKEANEAEARKFEEEFQAKLKEREEAFQIELKKRTEAEAGKSEAESADLRAQIEDLRAAAAQQSESSSGELQRLQEELRKQQEEQIRLSALLADVKDAPDEVATLRSEKENLQETVDRLKTALSSREEAIQAERQQSKMLQDFIKNMNEDMKKREVHVAAAEIEGSQEDLAAQVAALMKEKLELKADLSQKIDLFLETDNMRERKEKENLLKIEELEKELIDAKVKKSDNELIQDLERQVEFSHSIIATQQRRIDKLTEEIKQMNIALGQEGIAIEFEKKSKRKSAEQKKEIRKYCDICEEFDQHDTEDCPSQTLGEGDFEHKSHSSLDNAVEEKPASKRAWIRKFCDHCDEFDLHETEDCPNPQ